MMEVSLNCTLIYRKRFLTLYIEYCEIHIDIDNAPDEIQIFSKNGKDATADRSALHEYVRVKSCHELAHI